MRPDELAHKLAVRVTALLAARDAQDARRDQAVAALQKQIRDLEYTVATLQRDLVLAQHEAAR